MSRGPQSYRPSVANWGRAIGLVDFVKRPPVVWQKKKKHQTNEYLKTTWIENRPRLSGTITTPQVREQPVNRRWEPKDRQYYFSEKLVAEF